jgi:hypothetical protein
MTAPMWSRLARLVVPESSGVSPVASDQNPVGADDRPSISAPTGRKHRGRHRRSRDPVDAGIAILDGPDDLTPWSLP